MREQSSECNTRERNQEQQILHPEPVCYRQGNSDMSVGYVRTQVLHQDVNILADDGPGTIASCFTGKNVILEHGPVCRRICDIFPQHLPGVLIGCLAVAVIRSVDAVIIPVRVRKDASDERGHAGFDRDHFLDSCFFSQ